MLVLCALCAQLTPVAAADGSPVEVVRTTLAEMSARLESAGEDDEAAARAAVAATVWPRVDFEAVSRLVLGPHWNQASPRQRERFIGEFKKLLLASYTGAILSRADRPVSYPAQFTRIEADRALVATALEGDGPPLRIDYRLNRENGAWRVIDIVVAGVSLVTTYRSDFARRIEQQGIDGFLAALAERAARPAKS